MDKSWFSSSNSSNDNSPIFLAGMNEFSNFGDFHSIRSPVHPLTSSPEKSPIKAVLETCFSPLVTELGAKNLNSRSTTALGNWEEKKVVEIAQQIVSERASRASSATPIVDVCSQTIETIKNFTLQSNNPHHKSSQQILAMAQEEIGKASIEIKTEFKQAKKNLQQAVSPWKEGFQRNPEIVRLLTELELWESSSLNHAYAESKDVLDTLQKEINTLLSKEAKTKPFDLIPWVIRMGIEKTQNIEGFETKGRSEEELNLMKFTLNAIERTIKKSSLINGYTINTPLQKSSKNLISFLVKQVSPPIEKMQEILQSEVKDLLKKIKENIEGVEFPSKESKEEMPAKESKEETPTEKQQKSSFLSALFSPLKSSPYFSHEALSRKVKACTLDIKRQFNEELNGIKKSIQFFLEKEGRSEEEASKIHSCVDDYFSDLDSSLRFFEGKLDSFLEEINQDYRAIFEGCDDQDEYEIRAQQIGFGDWKKEVLEALRNWDSKNKESEIDLLKKKIRRIEEYQRKAFDQDNDELFASYATDLATMKKNLEEMNTNVDASEEKVMKALEEKLTASQKDIEGVKLTITEDCKSDVNYLVESCLQSKSDEDEEMLFGELDGPIKERFDTDKEKNPVKTPSFVVKNEEGNSIETPIYLDRDDEEENPRETPSWLTRNDREAAMEAPSPVRKEHLNRRFTTWLMEFPSKQKPK
jgi:hypothetical protein